MDNLSPYLELKTIFTLDMRWKLKRWLLLNYLIGMFHLIAYIQWWNPCWILESSRKFSYLELVEAMLLKPSMVAYKTALNFPFSFYSSYHLFLTANGHRDITAVDVSPTIITKMQQKYETLSGVEFLVCDIRELSGLSEDSYTLIIDKGCLDALFCRTDYKDAIQKTLEGIFKLLRMDGIYVSISHAPKLARVPYFRMIRWSIEVKPVFKTLNA